MSKRPVRPKWGVVRWLETLEVNCHSRDVDTVTRIYHAHAKGLYSDLFSLPNEAFVPIRRPIIRFLAKPRVNCWWLSCDSLGSNKDYEVWTGKPTWGIGGGWSSASMSIAWMCPVAFEAIYPKAKLRARTCKPIAPIKLVRI